MLKALCSSPPRTFSAKFMGRLRRLRTTCNSNSRLSTLIEHAKLYKSRTGWMPCTPWPPFTIRSAPQVVATGCEGSRRERTLRRSSIAS